MAFDVLSSGSFEDGTWQVCCYTHNLYRDTKKFYALWSLMFSHGNIIFYPITYFQSFCEKRSDVTVSLKSVKRG